MSNDLEFNDGQLGGLKCFPAYLCTCAKIPMYLHIMLESCYLNIFWKWCEIISSAKALKVQLSNTEWVIWVEAQVWSELAEAVFLSVLETEF